MTDGLQARLPAHVIVLGNEKGGSGKTTTAMHVIAHLLREGFRVGSIDLDGRQRSLTRYVENRKAWADAAGVNLVMPEHAVIMKSGAASVAAGGGAAVPAGALPSAGGASPCPGWPGVATCPAWPVWPAGFAGVAAGPSRTSRPEPSLAAPSFA